MTVLRVEGGGKRGAEKGEGGRFSDNETSREERRLGSHRGCITVGNRSVVSLFPFVFARGFFVSLESGQRNRFIVWNSIAVRRVLYGKGRRGEKRS